MSVLFDGARLTISAPAELPADDELEASVAPGGSAPLVRFVAARAPSTKRLHSRSWKLSGTVFTLQGHLRFARMGSATAAKKGVDAALAQVRALRAELEGMPEADPIADWSSEDREKHAKLWRDAVREVASALTRAVGKGRSAEIVPAWDLRCLPSWVRVEPKNEAARRALHDWFDAPD